jgi:hypothetical protein
VSAAPVNRLHAGQEPNDCAVCSLACYLGVSYTEVIRAVTLADRRAMGRDGLWRKTMVRVAARLGVKLLKRRPHPEDGYGIICAPAHAAVLREGFVLDRDTVWPLDAWLLDQRVTLDECDLLVAVD